MFRLCLNETNIPVYYFMVVQKLQAQDHTGSIETAIGKARGGNSTLVDNIFFTIMSNDHGTLANFWKQCCDRLWPNINLWKRTITYQRKLILHQAFFVVEKV